MTKINQALLHWKTGDVHGLDWLKEKGLSPRHSYFYYEEGLLAKLGPSVFHKSSDQINWPAVIRFLQEEEKIPLHVSGRTALEVHGHGHYIPLGKKPVVFVTSYEKKSFPAWLKKENSIAVFFHTHSNTFSREEFLTEIEVEGFKFKVSSRELAILEFIESLDNTHSLETAENYMNSLGTLRPEVLQKVLENCNSIQTKRIFLYLSEKLNLPFFEKLNLKKIALGSGKRLVVRGGTLNKKYQITVDKIPEENPF